MNDSKLDAGKTSFIPLGFSSQLSRIAGDVWHLEVKGCPKAEMLYGLRVFGEGGWETGHRWDPKRVLLDPYTPLISGRRRFGVREEREQYKKGVCALSTSIAVLSCSLRKQVQSAEHICPASILTERVSVTGGKRLQRHF